MEKPQKKTLRDRFEENYIPVKVLSPDTKKTKVEYVYYGPWYIWNLPAGKLRGIKIFCGLSYLVALIVFCASITMQTYLVHNRVMIGVSALTFCCFIMEISPVMQFVTAKKKVTKLRYDDVSRGFNFFTMARALLSVIGAIAGGIFILSGSYPTTGVWIVLGFTVSAVLAFAASICYGKIPFTTEDNDAIKQLEKDTYYIES
jgi:hypothetical protein